MQARPALLQPLLCLVIDSTLHKSFLDGIACGIQQRWLLPARFGLRYDCIFIKIFNCLVIHLHGGAKPRVEVIAQIQLRS